MPIGYALDHFLVWLLKQIVNVDIPVAFPVWNLLLALAGTLAAALLVTALPVRRAVHYRPGDALRYA